MDPDNSHEDLTALFELEDGVLQSDEFVSGVMSPIRRRVRLRQALLFGAGGIGLGAAMSQLAGFVGRVEIDAPSLSVLAQDVSSELATFSNANPMMMLSIVMMFACLAAMTAMERT